MDSKTFQFYFLLFLLSISFILAFVIFLPFIAALALALIFSVVLRPIHKRIHVSMPSMPGISALLTETIGVLGILLPLVVLGVLLVNQAESLYITLTQGSVKAYLQAPLVHLESAIQAYFPHTRFLDAFSLDVDTYLRHGLEWIINNMGTAFSKIASLLLSFFAFFFALYYLLRDGAALRRAVIRLSPLNDAEDKIILDRLELAINSVIKGNLTIALIQGILTAIGFTIFGIPNGILWGTIAAVGALIPGVGTTLVFFPATLFLFLTGAIVQAVGLVVWGALAVGLVDNFLGPRLIGNRMHMHPLFILLAVLGGIMFFGPIGVFLGPLSISLFLTLLYL
ncbi:AI-2E family transporter, partial [Candidatus Kaiserbacteria bacterium]|nr:AI-2E family transporter [Candidatus Kaiserbacteria bacterium]